jgi:hypothetical protein
MEEYRDIATEAPEYQPMEFWSSEREDQGIAEWLTGTYEASVGEGGPADSDLAAVVVGLPSAEQGEDVPAEGSGEAGASS